MKIEDDVRCDAVLLVRIFPPEKPRRMSRRAIISRRGLLRIRAPQSLYLAKDIPTMLSGWTKAS